MYVFIISSLLLFSLNVLGEESKLAFSSSNDSLSIHSLKSVTYSEQSNEAFYAYISKNYRCPVAIQEMGISGEVIVKFIVEKDGKVSNVRIVKDLGYGAGKELVRVVSKTIWTPGIQDGKPVRVEYTLPVHVNHRRKKKAKV